MSNSVNLALDVTKIGIQNPLIKVRQGDGGFETLHTTVTSNGEPLDLQGWIITFMGTTAGNHKIVDGNVNIIEAPNGIFDYTPSKAWGMDIGEFKVAYFKFVKGDGSASSANFRVDVIEAVDITQEEAKNYISVVDTTIAEVRDHLTSSLADVTNSVAATSSAAGSLAVYVSSTASSAVNEVNTTASNAVNTINTTASSAVSKVNSAASSASYVASSAANNVSAVASNAIDNVNNASNVYMKKTRELPAEARDFNYLATHMQTYQGTWWNGDEVVLNAPDENWAWSSIEVICGNGEHTGVIRTSRFASWFPAGHTYVATVDDGKISHWTLLADDANVVHNTGTETIAGDKTFTGVTNIQNQKQYKSSFTIGANTINLTRIGSIVYVNARIKEKINAGASYGVIPAGFTPANNAVISFIVNNIQGSCLFQADQKNVWFPADAPFDSNMSGSYLTSDALPS